MSLLGHGVPNAPCGVESLGLEPNTIASTWFLMHRVELKVSKSYFFLLTLFVPNAPCGVESQHKSRISFPLPIVPNAPCGVESFFSLRIPRT